MTDDVEIAYEYVTNTDLPREYGVNMQIRMKLIRDLYLKKMRLENDKQQELINKKRVEKEVKVGDLVFIKFPLKPGVSSKQNSTLIGPYRVHEVFEHKVTVKCKNGKSCYNVHKRRVKVINQDFEPEYTSWIDKSAIKLMTSHEDIEILDNEFDKNKTEITCSTQT